MPLTILRTSLVNAMFGGAFFLYFVFGTSYMKATGFTGSTPEVIGLIAAAFMLVFMIIGSLLADTISRRVILLVAAVVFLIFAIPYFYLVNTGSLVLATIAEIIGFGFGFVFGFGYGAIPTFYTENFPTRYRASGASAGYQTAQVYGGGLIPILAGLILDAYGIQRAYLYTRHPGDSRHTGNQRHQPRSVMPQRRASTRALTGAGGRFMAGDGCRPEIAGRLDHVMAA
jgi:MFS family permease